MVQSVAELVTGTGPAFEATSSQSNVLFLPVSSSFIKFPAVALVISGQKYIQICGLVLLLHWDRKFTQQVDINKEFQRSNTACFIICMDNLNVVQVVT